MNFDYCLQTKKNKSKKKHSTVINNFYFFVLDYLEPWLNLIIISVFILESRQAGEVRNREPQTRWLLVNARIDTLSLNFAVYWVEIFQIVTQNLLSQNYVDLLHLYHAQRCKWCHDVICKCVILYSLRNITQKLLFLIFWYFAFLYSLSFMHC